MKYFSTRNHNINNSFKQILFQGLSKDGGLYLPTYWPKINLDEVNNITYEELALNIIYPYIQNDISKNEIYEIICKSYKNFNHPKIAPIVQIDENKYILELFYGPTLAFKDYALQLLGNLLTHFMASSEKKITILGATSGDTGSAAINAFKGKKNINIFILHPLNKVSEVQRRQMTTVLNDNVFNIAVDGTFDDCQKIVKDLFNNTEVQNKTSLTAVNSINWARIMAQVVYYFWAYLQIAQKKISFIVPSGNFGNIYAARVAKHMGLPINDLHIVTNQNDILHKIISLGKMQITNVKETYSPSMDIQVSSNFERQIFESLNFDSNELIKIMQNFNKNKNYLFSEQLKLNFQNIYKSSSVSDKKTLQTIKLFKETYNYLADPHTATGLSVMHETNLNHPTVCLGCAHPAKFSNAIKKSIGIEPEIPKVLENIFDKEEKMNILSNKTEDIKNFILNNI